MSKAQTVIDAKEMGIDTTVFTTVKMMDAEMGRIKRETAKKASDRAHGASTSEHLGDYGDRDITQPEDSDLTVTQSQGSDLEIRIEGVCYQNSGFGMSRWDPATKQNVNSVGLFINKINSRRLNARNRVKVSSDKKLMISVVLPYYKDGTQMTVDDFDDRYLDHGTETFTNADGIKEYDNAEWWTNPNASRNERPQPVRVAFDVVKSTVTNAKGVTSDYFNCTHFHHDLTNEPIDETWIGAHNWRS